MVKIDDGKGKFIPTGSKGTCYNCYITVVTEFGDRSDPFAFGPGYWVDCPKCRMRVQVYRDIPDDVAQAQINKAIDDLRRRGEWD